MKLSAIMHDSGPLISKIGNPEKMKDLTYGETLHLMQLGVLFIDDKKQLRYTDDWFLRAKGHV